MNIYYSPSASGFYDPAIHRVIPADAVEIAVEEHAALLAAQAAGKVIRPDSAGRPYAVAVKPPPATAADVKAEARRRLADTDWTAIRKADTAEPMPDAVAAHRAAVRAASAALEAMTPIPADYAADARWPAPPAA